METLIATEMKMSKRHAWMSLHDLIVPSYQINNSISKFKTIYWRTERRNLNNMEKNIAT